MNGRRLIRASSRFVTLGVVATLLFGWSAARAGLIFSDSFQYAVGALNGDGPPPGSPPGQSGWTTTNGNTQVIAAGLSFMNLFSAGGAASFSDTGSNGDSSFASVTPVNSGVVWVSFLIREVSGSFGYATLNLRTPDGSPPTGYGVIFAENVFGIDNDTGLPGGQAETQVAPGPNPTWLVVKLDFTTGEQVLYINPTQSSDGSIRWAARARLLMTPQFQAVGFDRVLLHVGYSRGTFEMDEVRLGGTFAEVRMGP